MIWIGFIKGSCLYLGGLKALQQEQFMFYVFKVLCSNAVSFVLGIDISGLKGYS